MKTVNKIEIKNVKFAAFASQETNCFEATLYVDGKRFANVSNDGHGGPDDVYPLNTMRREDIASWRKRLECIETNLKNGPKVESKYFADGMDNCLELVVGNLMNQWHQDKEIKTILKRVSYIKNGGLYQQPARVKPTPMNLINIKNAPWWKKDNILLTGLSVQDARAQLATINFFGEL
jgi:hypothetical protein